MTELQIRIPQNQPELETAIQQFLQDEFQQNSEFATETNPEITHKGGDPSLIWQILTVIATIDGVINLAQRAQRLERVQKLLAAIQRAGQPVYIKIKGKTHDLYQKTADEIMNLLAGDDNGDD
uniref:Uncharacterized protein n=1 Tax=uncultured Thiotrichaceae bacterium TaxID=298394 RepID=A0A6S6UMF0_9GAMM|nr:MAG: Unknown protein [uncultured Thiotrichaceae bacterium]